MLLNAREKPYLRGDRSSVWNTLLAHRQHVGLRWSLSIDGLYHPRPKPGSKSAEVKTISYQQKECLSFCLFCVHSSINYEARCLFYFLEEIWRRIGSEPLKSNHSRTPVGSSASSILVWSCTPSLLRETCTQ